MKNKEAPVKYLPLFLPWIIATLISGSSTVSYLVAWLGSFFIFFMSYSGSMKPLPDDLPISRQIMRPIFLVQIIFAGYMCCTSIFYVMNIYGYHNFQKIYAVVDENQLALAAACQRYYCLGHASFTTGLLCFIDYRFKKNYALAKLDFADLLFWAAVISFPLSIIFLVIPGLSQFSNQFTSLSFIGCTVALAFAIPRKKILNTLICLFLYISNFLTALTSGFKEPILLSVLVLGIFLYPTYKRMVLITFVPAILFLFLVLPTYAAVFRQSAWTGAENAEEAKSEALDAALNKESVADETTWDFLVYRLSEIDMFTQFIETTPAKIHYYNFDLIKQAFIVLVPRIFWSSKPNTEQLVMQRVYAAGVINPNSTVSAKPAYVVDAYLSGGAVGVFLSLFIYGAIVQLISLRAESLFGGYEIGTALIFSGLFQIFWRGLSFEFIFNNVFWGYCTMILIADILRNKNILKEVD
ncbi:exosortase Y-associated Wzy-like protein [Mucilaginibacter aquaedulcis]|uniref:exosortase Y-associated Wzy-like protein n=1 Tax=Mucilaginibacter aquaedulcis TaxID=1187081 RepID=UPI0025B374BE|nr:hypothetical protein [Mucilaginibacter aquaedulcis]MDN3548745.1 hypothetical protein [Mucilaginibacter aquaedulcis]